MTFTLRPAEPDDAKALTACIDAAYAGYRDKGIDLPPVSEGVADDIRDGAVIVAVDGGKVIGGAVLSLSGRNAMLKNVAVHPAQAGRGIGKALLAEALTAAREAGHSRITLVTHRDMPGNISFYETLGWRIASRENEKVQMTHPLD